MSAEEKDKEPLPDETENESFEPEQDLEEAIHDLAPEEDQPASDEDLRSQDVVEELSPEELENSPEDDALSPPKEKPVPRRQRRGFFDLLVVLVLAGLGVGEYLFVERQKAQQNFLDDRFTKVEQSIKSLQSRKSSTPPAPPAEIQETIDGLQTEIQGLKEQLATIRNQQEQTTNWVKGELEKIQSAPAPAAPPEAEEEEPEEPEEAEEVTEEVAEEPKHETHESESGNPADDFIDFVENIGGIVIDGLKDGVVFVWDKISDLINSGGNSPPPAPTPASDK